MNSRHLFGLILFITGSLLCRSYPLKAQKSYFIDGYHGGIWGHFPYHYASFMAGELQKNPDWDINLEIEPVTWDSIERIDPKGYAYIKAALEDSSVNARVEYVNPAYGQSYMFNISGESIIRQFQYGMRALRKHFPLIQFNTYSSEEPCFTSALPGILRSLGFKYASLKNPNTCWGGYVAGIDAGVINWTGPDGSKILTVPRYATEQLEKGSTWQTTAWRNSPAYIQSALDAGVRYPIGMCLQDAGWTGGPWLRDDSVSIYTTWRHYFEKVIDSHKDLAIKNWKLSQEDIKVSLVWGSQILQKVARSVRKTENTLINLESVLTLQHLYQKRPWPKNQLDSAWKDLLLAQHHDTWIVPNNKKHGKNWQQYVGSWTGQAMDIAESLLQKDLSVAGLQNENGNVPINGNTEELKHKGENPADSYNGAEAEQNYIRVYNSSGLERTQLVSVKLPASAAGKSVRLLDQSGHELRWQIDQQQSGNQLYFYASVPALGYSTYQIQVGGQSSFGDKTDKMASVQPDGKLLVQSDRYRIVFDPAKGGMITSLQLKKGGDRGHMEFVDQSRGGLNELKGFFYEENSFRSSQETPATLKILDNGPLLARVQVKGFIAGSPFTQTVQVDKKGRLITTDLQIDWKGHPGIGQFDEDGRFKNENLQKAFYNSQYKLQTLFPVQMAEGIIHKDAPFDIVESRLKNTFYDRWDHIKNDVLLHWADLSSQDGKAGFAILSDQTTSYAHGPKMALGLTTQYSGTGLFGADYTINGPTHMRYGFLPHKGNWKAGQVSQASEAFNKPLLSVVLTGKYGKPLCKNDWTKSALQLDPASGWEVTAFKVDRKGGDRSVLLRLWNAAGNDKQYSVNLNRPVRRVSLMELDGRVKRAVKLNRAGNKFELAIPAKGIMTIRLEGW